MNATIDVNLETLRRRALAVAYRMLGSRTDAEDIAQEATLRTQIATSNGDVRSPEAFITTVTTRLALDHLRSARVRREQYVGPWLPEPVTSDAISDISDSAVLADSLSFAFLVMLESLGPVERAALILRDVFEFDYAEIAGSIQRSEPATRQLVARARHRVADRRPRFEVDREHHRVLLDRFLEATSTGDLDGIMSMLADDVSLVNDGGPSRRAARYPILGRVRVARFLRNVGPRLLTVGRLERILLNGEPGFARVEDGTVTLAGTIETHGDVISGVRWVLNPDKLHWVSVEARS